MPSSHGARTKIDEQSFENRRKSTSNGSQINEKSILCRFGRPRPFRVRVQTRSERSLDQQMPAQSRSWGALSGPRAVRSCPKASPERPRDTPRAFGTAPQSLVSTVRVAQRCQKRWRIGSEMFSINARTLRSAFRVVFYRVLSMSNVLCVPDLQ